MDATGDGWCGTTPRLTSSVDSGTPVAGHARTPGQDRRVAAKGCHAVRETRLGIPVRQARVVHCNESASYVGHTQTRITTGEGTTPQIRTVCPFPFSGGTAPCY